MKNSIKKIEGIIQSQIIHQESQKKLKGGTGVLKVCGPSGPVESSSSSRSE